MKRSQRLIAVLLLAAVMLPMFHAAALADSLDLFTAKELEERKMVIKTNQALLQDSPMGGNILASLKKKTVVYFIASVHNGLWYHVATKDGLTGYIFWDEAKFVHKPTSPEILELLFDDEEMKQMVMKVSGNCVNMRAGIAGTKEHKQIVNYYDGLMNNETVYCISQKKNWYLVVRAKRSQDSGHLVGWVYGDFLNNKDVNKWNKYVGGVPANQETIRKLQMDRTAAKIIRTLENR